MQTKHEKLRVWQEAMSLSEMVYIVSQAFPRREDFVLTAQLRRAALSVPANIAEGCGRFHTREFMQYLYTARGSLFELMTLLELCLRFRYIAEDYYRRLREKAEGVLAGLSALLRSLETRVIR